MYCSFVQRDLKTRLTQTKLSSLVACSTHGLFVWKSLRIPQWYDQYWNINTGTTTSSSSIQHQSTNDMKLPPIHRYVHGQESHSITEQIHNSNRDNNNDSNSVTSSSNSPFRMTGEPAGRDMWIAMSANNETQNTKGCGVSDDIIQALASGGRPYTGFNPNINPNRYVMSY